MKEPKFKVGDRVKYDQSLSGKGFRYAVIDMIDIIDLKGTALQGKYRYWGNWDNDIGHKFVMDEDHLSSAPLENPQPEQKKHKHSELIKAWADGAEIQTKISANEWMDINHTPIWDTYTEYRIKPKEIEVSKRIICDTSLSNQGYYAWNTANGKPNLKLTFHPDTKKLIKAEVIE